ncbi:MULTISPECIES: alpha/beta fold hydrolase [Sutcliffiella]|uniref:Serine aminopeptidase S33 domain-containing protein n=1 Tax=Sutcliffiella cohnii TaxID=33932 RepID=A0A223KPZ3_9BACI|nr:MULTISPECIES: alpha/beta hydrolase [Sutcliffiella]AST91476.1 hypothetical protein BC6307_09380 [Sutcliffiella cohnii]WBL17308.1 alpha/beta hydrolase [Sutcliffiella sp. NC1]
MPHIRTRDGVQIYAEKLGSGNTTIIFIHPPGMGHVTFKQQKPLSSRYSILLMDLRGNGKSSVGTQQITFSLLAQDIYDVMKHFDIKSAILCGYSNGASIALEFALRYPSSTKGLVLVGAFPKVNSLLLYAEFMLGILVTKLNAMPLISFVIGRAHAHSKGYGKQLESYIRKTKAKTLHKMYNEGVKFDRTERLQEIKAPILLVYGKKDFYVHHYQKEFRHFHRNTDVVYISKAKHQVPTKFAKEFNSVVSSFIRRKCEV